MSFKTEWHLLFSSSTSLSLTDLYQTVYLLFSGYLDRPLDGELGKPEYESSLAMLRDAMSQETDHVRKCCEHLLKYSKGNANFNFI